MKKNINRSNSKRKRFSFGLIAIPLAVITVLIITEIFLRVVPIPGIGSCAGKYDPLTGAIYNSNSTNIYRNERGDYALRKVNSWGYLDKEFKKEKEVGVYRIGFFGDSFTEARQVPLEQTFYRLIEDSLKDYNVETLSFGISGFGTLQSYLNSKRYTDFFDLDMVVYVFFGNDPSDQLKKIKGSEIMPYPILADGGFKIDNSFKEKNKHKEKIYFKIGDYLLAHSLVLSTIAQRVRYLLKQGIKIKVTKEDRLLADEPIVKSKFNIYFPSTWLGSLRKQAQKLEDVVISQWKEDVGKHSKAFVIAAIPDIYGFRKDASSFRLEDSWKSWLSNYCQEKGINFVDSTPYLMKMKDNGKEVFYDHFTKDGHIGFASSFVDWFKKIRLSKPGGGNE